MPPSAPRAAGPDGPAAEPGSPSFAVNTGSRRHRRVRATPARVVAVAVLAVLLGASAGLFELLGVPRGAGAAGTHGGGGPAQTSDPRVATAANPIPHFNGAILFAREGDIWSASASGLTRVSRKGTDSSPIWSADGRRILFLETDRQRARAPYQGHLSTITLEYPTLMTMAADGTDRRPILSSLIKLPGPPDARFFFHLAQPDLSPDGTQVALVSDAADPFGSDVTLGLVPARGGTIRTLPIKDNPGLGHNDPSWSPDGKRIAFSYNGRDGATGTPRIAVFDTSAGTLRFVGGIGFANPDWSPDGRYVVAEQTDGKGRNLVVLDAGSGAVVSRLTTDSRSFAPTFSPDGSQVAYLHLDRGAIDIRLLSLSSDGTFRAASDQAITADGAVDGRSPLSWSPAGGTGTTP
jgi:Tol biopolymer transport system component